MYQNREYTKKKKNLYSTNHLVVKMITNILSTLRKGLLGIILLNTSKLDTQKSNEIKFIAPTENGIYAPTDIASMATIKGEYGLPIRSYEIYLDNQAPFKSTNPVYSKDNTIILPVDFKNQSEGKHTLEVLIEDLNGNKYSGKVNFTTDSTPPQISNENFNRGRFIFDVTDKNGVIPKIRFYQVITEGSNKKYKDITSKLDVKKEDIQNGYRVSILPIKETDSLLVQLIDKPSNLTFRRIRVHSQ